MDKKHVAVLMGGFSAERPVSLSSGNACADALEAVGYRVTRVDVDHHVSEVLAKLKPDVAFNALHGPYGEDGRIQGDIGQEHPMAPPYVVKPVNEGSSLGVVIVQEGQAHPPQILGSGDWTHGERVMVERFVYGRELTCAVMGDQALGVIEIMPIGHSFYDFDSKYIKGGSNHACPAKILPNIYQKIQKVSLMAHQALGCRGISRSDFRYDDRFSEDGELVWLEVNTQPGMTPTSLVPELAEHAGYGFGELLTWMVEDASCTR